MINIFCTILLGRTLSVAFCLKRCNCSGLYPTDSICVLSLVDERTRVLEKKRESSDVGWLCFVSFFKINFMGETVDRSTALLTETTCTSTRHPGPHSNLQMPV